MATQLIQAAQQALDAFDAFGEDDDFASLFALSQKMEALRTALQSAQASEPVARVELMQTGGNTGLATRIVEIDDPLRERLHPGDVLYTHPAPGVPEDVVRDAERYRWLRTSLPAGQGSLTVLLDDGCGDPDQTLTAIAELKAGKVGTGGTATVTREMIGAAHDVMLAKGDFVLSANLLERIYLAMEQAAPPAQTPFGTGLDAAIDAAMLAASPAQKGKRK